MSSAIIENIVAKDITENNIRQTLQNKINPTFLQVIDESQQHRGHAGVALVTEGGTHFRVQISAPVFQSLARVKQHQLVYDALRPYFESGLHALAIEVLK